MSTIDIQSKKELDALFAKTEEALNSPVFLSKKLDELLSEKTIEFIRKFTGVKIEQLCPEIVGRIKEKIEEKDIEKFVDFLGKIEEAKKSDITESVLEALFNEAKDKFYGIDSEQCKKDEEKRFFTDYARVGNLAIVALFLDNFDKQIVFDTLLIKEEPEKPAFFDGLEEGNIDRNIGLGVLGTFSKEEVEAMGTPRMNYGALNNKDEKYEFWSLKPELNDYYKEPEWEKVFDQAFSEPIEKKPNSSWEKIEDKVPTPLMIRAHKAKYILNYKQNSGKGDILSLISAETTEHHFNLFDSKYQDHKAQDTITEDLYLRPLNRIVDDDQMLEYIKTIREFRRQRAIYLRTYPAMYTKDLRYVQGSGFNKIAPVQDVLVRTNDEIRHHAKKWLWERSDEYRQNLIEQHPEIEKYYDLIDMDNETDKNVNEVLMFLLGWGYVERKTEAKLNSPEQIERYPFFVDKNGKFYISKSYRMRGVGNRNFYPKERFAYLLGKNHNYVEILQPKLEEAPLLYDEKKYNLDLGGPYLSYLTINHEHDFNEAPLENTPNLITDIKIIRSWLLVWDIALRNNDAKFPNVSFVELEIPGEKTRHTILKIDPDFEIDEQNLEIIAGYFGYSFASKYIDSRYRYYSLDKDSFDIRNYDLKAFKEAIEFIKSMRGPKMDDIAGDAQLPTHSPKFGLIVGDQVFTKKEICKLLEQTICRIEEDAIRMLALMVGIPLKDMEKIHMRWDRYDLIDVYDKENVVKQRAKELMVHMEKMATDN